MAAVPASVLGTPPVLPLLPVGAALAALLLGLGAVHWQARLPTPLPWACFAAAALLGSALAARRWAWRWPVCGLLVLGLAAAGLAWSSWRAELRLQQALPVAWEGRSLRVDVEIDELPQRLTGGERTLTRLRVRPLAPARDDDGLLLDLPPRLSLWVDGSRLPPQWPRAGERWRFELRLRRIHGLQNPGLPDSELWLLERGILAQGNVRAASRLAEASPWSLQGWRHDLRDRIDAVVSEPRQRAVLAGLLLGDQAALSSADWALLRDTGVVHLFSISGVHITCFAWLAGWLIARGWPLRLARRCPTPLAARWGGVLLATAYALLAGWGVPAQRTVSLLLLLALLQSSGRLWPWPLALLACAVPIALADPWALMQPGFWLSFVAVALLMQHGPAVPMRGQRGGWQQAWRQLLHTQAVCTLGLAPLTLLFFGQLSVVGVLANLIAVPTVTLVLTPLVLLGALLPALWWLAGAGVQALFALLQPLADLPWAVWQLPEAPLALQALSLLGLLLAALRLPRRWRALGLLMLLPLFAWQPARPADGAFRLRVFDVGQGSAVWLQTAGHEMLYDAGPRWGEQDAAARLLLPSLRAAGVRRLDLLLISHGDADHAGGAASLLRAFPAASRSTPMDPRLAALQAGTCAAGQRWRWDGVDFQILHPPAASALRGNASSCVLRVVAADGSAVLLTGDIGLAEERRLLADAAELRSDLLLLGHHGSARSSSPAFLAAVAPRLAFAQSGYRNRHGHPALPVQTRLREFGIPLLTSAGCGAYDWWSGMAPSDAGCWRRQRQRYWHQRGLAGSDEIDVSDDAALQGPPEPGG